VAIDNAVAPFPVAWAQKGTQRVELPGCMAIPPLDGTLTRPGELIHGERESFIGGYRQRRSGIGVGRPGANVGGGGT
jgi:hypothetical protein